MKIYAEERLEAEIVLKPYKKMVKPSRRRGMAQQAVAEDGSIRQACLSFGISQAC